MSSYRTLLAVTALSLAGVSFAQSPSGTPAPGNPGAPGAASPAETVRPMMRHGHHHGGGKMGRHLDTDGDGQISKAELQAAHERRLAAFDRADANKDGKLSPEEMRSFRREHRGSGRPGGPGAPARSGVTISPNA